MEVTAIKRGFDGLKLRGLLAHNGVYEDFDFLGFKMWLEGDEIKDNLGSWMKLTKDGEKEYSKMAASLKREKTKAKKKADS